MKNNFSAIKQKVSKISKSTKNQNSSCVSLAWTTKNIRHHPLLLPSLPSLLFTTCTSSISLHHKQINKWQVTILACSNLALYSHVNKARVTSTCYQQSVICMLPRHSPPLPNSLSSLRRLQFLTQINGTIQRWSSSQCLLKLPL